VTGAGCTPNSAEPILGKSLALKENILTKELYEENERAEFPRKTAFR
jgi:hypothetical protein